MKELRDAYPRPSATDTDTALRTVMLRAAGRDRRRKVVLRLTAMLAGLSVAYAAGFAMGRSGSADAGSERSPEASATTVAQVTVRPPVLVAGPQN